MTTYQATAYRIRQLFSTLAAATASNPVLLEGEKWSEKSATTGRFTGRTKTGDGVVTGTAPNQTIVGTAFNDLPFDPTSGGGDPAGTAAAAIAAHVALADAHPGYTTPQEAAAAAPVQSVALTPPSGWSASSSNAAGSVTLTLGLPAGSSLPSNASQTTWDTAYTERLQWSGGATGLNAATGRASLQLGTAAQSATSDFATAAQGTRADTAVQPAALTSKADLVGGLVPSAQLPGFVDDVLEFANVVAFPATGETGKLYLSLATNRAYRWSGSIYVEINPSPGSTDAVPEGSVNLYFTTARGEAAAVSWWAASAAKTKLDGIASGATANASDAQLRDRANHTGTQAAGTITGLAAVATSGAYADLSGRFNPATPGAIGGGTAAAGSFTALSASSLGLGVAAVTDLELAVGGAVVQLRQSVTAASGVYTLDVTASNEFITSAAIAGATTINLGNLASLPSSYSWTAKLRFSYTSGTIAWFSGNTGYTVRWDGGSAPQLNAGDQETVIIEAVGGSSIIEVVAMRGRA